MKNTTQESLKWKWTDPTGKSEKFHSAQMG